MRLWTLLAPLGSLPSGADAGATSRAWYEELRLAPVVAESLRDRGLDEAGAWWAAERVRLLLDLPLPSAVGGRGAAGLPLRVVDAWLADPVVRSFLRVNRWDGAEWFHRESWVELLAWADRLERVQTPARGPGPTPGRAIGPRRAASRRPPRRPATRSRVCGRRSPSPPSRRPSSHPRPSHRPRPRPSRGSRRPPASRRARTTRRPIESRPARSTSRIVRRIDRPDDSFNALERNGASIGPPGG